VLDDEGEAIDQDTSKHSMQGTDTISTQLSFLAHSLACSLVNIAINSVLYVIKMLLLTNISCGNLHV
jgi:hypothetical protein